MASHDERVTILHTFLRRSRRLAELFGIPIHIALRVVRHVAHTRAVAESQRDKENTRRLEIIGRAAYGGDDDNPA